MQESKRLGLEFLAIFIVIFLLAFIAMGSYGKEIVQNAIDGNQNQANVAFTVSGPMPVAFLSSVKGCAKNGDDETTRSKSEMIEQAPQIIANVNSVSYSRATNHLCCRTAQMNYSISGKEISVYEIWGGIGCRCMCSSTLGAEIGNLGAGKYNVLVYGIGTNPEGGEMEKTLITSGQVEIR